MTLTEEQRDAVAFDLEAARAGISHYRIENPSNVDTESALKELVDQANLAEDAIAEIERLRPFEIAARDLDSDLTKIAGERDDQAARIKELEDALVEELARGDYFDESQECEGYWWDRKNTSDCTQNDYRRNARLKLQAKGKIGPDADAKPRVWQITEERVEALQDAVNRYDVYDRCLVTHDRKVHVLGVLRAMLTEARQE